MNRPLAIALVSAFLAGAAGLAIAQPKGPPAMPPPVTDPAQVPAGHYVSDPHHGGFVLKVQHMGLDQSYFRMDKFDASFDYDPAHPGDAKVKVAVDTKVMVGWFGASRKRLANSAEIPGSPWLKELASTATFTLASAGWAGS